MGNNDRSQRAAMLWPLPGTHGRGQMMAEMTKGAMPMTAGTMMMMHDGKMYMMPDKMMPNGKMMSDMAMGK